MKLSFLKKLLIVGVLAFSVHNSSAQSNQVCGLGRITNVQIAQQKVKLATQFAYAEISVYSPAIVRVRIDKKPLSHSDFSYAVVAQPERTKVRVEDNKRFILIKTDSISVHIDKETTAIKFLTPQGDVINEDDDGLTTSWIGEEVTTYKKLQEGERFIGLGEKTGDLDRRGNGYTNWNTDAFGYTATQDPIYASIPFYIGVHNEMCYGIFLDNTYQTDFNFGASNNRFSSFSAQGGEMNYYFIYQPTVSGIISSYTFLTGRMPLPPLWSLGYQQNRYSYYPETEVFRIAQTLREKKIPADGITLDIHYMDKYKLFTWNQERFPHHREMIDSLLKMGFKTTVIVDPGIKVEKGYGAYERGKQGDIFLKYADNSYFTAQVWPGWCHFPDFTSKKGREWWKREINFYTRDGVAGLWNDMNEIATWGQKMPNNILFDYDGNKTTHKQGRNIYGMQMSRSSYEGAREGTEKRPFLLSRAGYAGLQRYAAMWTGDNTSEDHHMLLGVRLLNSLGICGIPFTGMDIGGFLGNPSRELYARWIQIGSFTPYFRNHAGSNSKASEPWTYGEHVLNISRNYISLRYRLLPYLYSTFFESTQNGLPIMRSLAISHTHDPKIYDPKFQNQYLFGEAFLVVPFESTKDYGNIYFPGCKWFNLYNDEQIDGKQEKIYALSIRKLPVFVKEGSIIPMQSLIQSTSMKPTDTLQIHIYNGEAENSFIYYEDDGESYEFEKGSYHKRLIEFNPASRSIMLKKPEGNFHSKFRFIKFILHGFDCSSVAHSGTFSIPVKDEAYSMINYAPESSNDTLEHCSVKTFVLNNSSETITIKY
jgi:alpha-glucosidase